MFMKINEAIWSNPDGHYIHFFFPSFCKMQTRVFREIACFVATAALFSAPLGLVMAANYALFPYSSSSEYTKFLFLLIAVFSTIFALFMRVAIVVYSRSDKRHWLGPTLAITLIVPAFIVAYICLNYYLRESKDIVWLTPAIHPVAFIAPLIVILPAVTFFFISLKRYFQRLSQNVT